MIITEYYRTRDDGVVLNRTYSDAGMMILQNETGIPKYYNYTDSDGNVHIYNGSAWKQIT